MGREDDIDKLIDWAVSQGWSVTTDSKGYRRFYTPAGEYVVRYPKGKSPNNVTPLRAAQRGVAGLAAKAGHVTPGRIAAARYQKRG